MTHITSAAQDEQSRANRAGASAEVSVPASIRLFPSRSPDVLALTNGNALSLEANEQSVANDPLAGSASRPKGAHAPPGNVIFSGASAAYYAALFAAEAVKSLGDVQDAYNKQEVESFEHLETVWDQFARQDKRFIAKQGQSYLWSSIAAFGGAALSAGAFVWGIGATKGWGFLPGSEDLQGQIDQLEGENDRLSEAGTFSVRRNVQLEDEAAQVQDAQATIRVEDEPTTTTQREEDLPAGRTEAELTRVENDSVEDGVEGPESRRTQRAQARRQEEIADDAQDADSVRRSNNKSKIKTLHEKIKRKTAQFQTIAGTVQQLGQAGSSLGQGLGQVQSSGVAQHRDQYDKAKQLTQQVFNVENTGWNSAVQTLKEMTSAAARSINEITSAQQRA